jgi:hypothetical protein
MGVRLIFRVEGIIQIGVFENGVLRRRSEPGEIKCLHTEELHNVYCPPNIIWMIKSRRMRWVQHVARIGGMRNAYKIVVGKPEGKRPLGRPMRRLDDNIKMDLRNRVGGCRLDSSGPG